MFYSMVLSCLAFELFVTCKKSYHSLNDLIYRHLEYKLLKMAIFENSTIVRNVEQLSYKSYSCHVQKSQDVFSLSYL